MEELSDLQKKAKLLRDLLNKYITDRDVKDVYEQIRSLLDDIETGLVIGPMRFPYSRIFFRGENNLPAYPDICNAAAEFVDELENVNG